MPIPIKQFTSAVPDIYAALGAISQATKDSGLEASLVELVKVLGPTYEPGSAEGSADWKEKLQTSADRMAYVRTAMRYWYSDDWFGSERRKQEA